MKKALLVITIFILGLSSIAEAQIIVNSTQASTIKEKSSRQKGLVLRTDIGAGFLYGPNVYSINLSGNIGYQFNPFITLGGGLGIEYLEDGSLAIPFYFDVKGYFSNRVWSPYYNIKLGYSANIYYPLYSPTTTANAYVGLYGVEYGYEYKLEGTYIAIALGLNYKNFDFGIELSFMGSTDYYCQYYYYYDQYSSITTTDKSYNDYITTGLKLKFGYNFPLYKKK